LALSIDQLSSIFVLGRLILEEFKAKLRIVSRWAGVFFAVLLGIYLIFQIPQIVLIFLLALLFAIVLSGPVNYLAHMGLPRGLGVLVVLASLVLVLWLLSKAVIPVVQAQTEQFIGDFPALLAQTQGVTTSLESAFGLENETILDPQRPLDAGRTFLSGHTTVSSVVDIGRNIAEAVSLSVVAVIVTIYLVVSPAPLVNGFVALFPAGQRERVREVLGKMYHAVQKWVLGQLSAMVIIGVLTAITLSIIGIPYALSIGALSGLLAFLPLIGVLISIIPPVLLALTINPILVVWVILSYIVVHQIEAHVIQPVVMSRAVSLHPVVIVLAILVMGTLFGLVGVLLAVPLVAALGVLVQELWIPRMNQQGIDPHPPSPKVEETLRKTGLLGRVLNALRRS
jgi:predicted PurR-regulated permease PerM